VDLQLHPKDPLPLNFAFTTAVQTLSLAAAIVAFMPAIIIRVRIAFMPTAIRVGAAIQPSSNFQHFDSQNWKNPRRST